MRFLAFASTARSTTYVLVFFHSRSLSAICHAERQAPETTSNGPPLSPHVRVTWPSMLSQSPRCSRLACSSRGRCRAQHGNLGSANELQRYFFLPPLGLARMSCRKNPQRGRKKGEPSNCVYVTGFCRHGTPVFRIAFAMVTSLRAMATITSLCGLPCILRR